MQALAEQLPHTADTNELHLDVLEASETSFDLEARERYAQWAGSLVVASEIRESLEPTVSLYERILAANKGSEEAKNSVRTNVATALFEAVFKKNYVGEIFMDLTNDGQLVQHGQSNEDIQKNTMLLRGKRHELLEKITEAEARNRHRIETALVEGELDEKCFVAFSLVPNEVPKKDLGPQGDGYFLNDLTLNIQATSKTPNKRVKTETGFMAGVEGRESDSFDELLTKRFDFQAVARLYEWFGKKAPETAHEILDSPLYIPKELMPNGVTDVMYWLSVARDDVLERQTQSTRGEYAALKLESKRKENRLQDVQEKILQDALMLGPLLDEPIQAVHLVWELVRQHATEAAVTNYDIDPRALGRLAASELEMARYHTEKGNHQLADQHKQKAHQQSETSGCGGGATAEAAESELEKIAGKDSKGARAFRCKLGHLNIRPKEKLLPSCQHPGCKAQVACK